MSSFETDKARARVEKIEALIEGIEDLSADGWFTREPQLHEACGALRMELLRAKRELAALEKALRRRLA